MLKRFPYDYLSLQVNELLPDEAKCIDVDQKKPARKRSDESLWEAVGKLFPDTDITSLEMAERKVVVRSLVEKGFAVSQIARAMGLSYDQVFNVVRVRRK